jgi:hypothetical protein
MSREVVREMKRALSAGMCEHAPEHRRRQARLAALGLLERSVQMHHDRLALQRLATAVHLGADVPEDHWAYCRQTASASRRPEIQALFLECAQSQHRDTTTGGHSSWVTDSPPLRHEPATAERPAWATERVLAKPTPVSSPWATSTS